MDNNGTPVVEAEKVRPDTRARAKQEAVAPSRSRERDDPLAQLYALFLQLHKRRLVRGRPGANHNVERRKKRKDYLPEDLAQASFDSIPIYGVATILGNNDSDSRATKKGSEEPNLEIRGSESLPLLAYRIELSFPREPLGPREASTLRRRRTWRAV